jgi:hypothetical protein
MSERRPDILLIQADQLSAAALGAYGNRVVDAPHLHALAEDVRAPQLTLVRGRHKLVHSPATPTCSSISMPIRTS